MNECTACEENDDAGDWSFRVACFDGFESKVCEVWTAVMTELYFIENNDAVMIPCSSADTPLCE